MKERGKASKAQQHSDSNGFFFSAPPSDKDELLDRLYWSRQIIGLICGIIWGFIPLVGAIWIAVFVALSSSAIFGFYNMVLKIDEEEYGGHGPLLQEGIFTSVMLFLLSWILVYSLLHF